MNIKRLGRIESEINRVLSDCICNGIKDNRVNPSITSITKVSLTNDLGICYVKISVFGDDKVKEKTLSGLEHATGYFKKRIAETLDLRHTPKLIFKLDESFEKGVLMNELITKVSKEDEEKRKLYGTDTEEE
ncbi:MAG: 30S ribosome-binding factor RbfA [Peptoniphilaceae bacterium]|uniref:30S ribosome-binding factor RbfA n=1 Tax=Parvimonas sp. TaxID=1944660 RepID=UPI0025E17783|nr:30S ribosome-binding factor RbfA [Parvimonas sp.]MCI5997687.1 30S ribosome-binding factor RbfA [Parvimonas sp.]MDD7765541.1 30S ribosome-binding factor RbfA [Peptoniphilaceae bacterium]